MNWYCWQTFMGAFIIINGVLFSYLLICLDRIQSGHDKQRNRLLELSSMLNKLQDTLEIPRDRPGLSNDERFALWQEWRKVYFCGCKKDELKIK